MFVVAKWGTFWSDEVVIIRRRRRSPVSNGKYRLRLISSKDFGPYDHTKTYNLFIKARCYSKWSMPNKKESSLLVLEHVWVEWVEMCKRRWLFGSGFNWKGATRDWSGLYLCGYQVTFGGDFRRFLPVSFGSTHVTVVTPTSGTALTWQRHTLQHNHERSSQTPTYIHTHTQMLD